MQFLIGLFNESLENKQMNWMLRNDNGDDYYYLSSVIYGLYTHSLRGSLSLSLSAK